MRESTLWMYILDENNNVIPTKDYELIEKFYSSKRKIVRQTTVRDRWISTVLLSIDHDYSWDAHLIRWNEDKPNPNPIVFETMIFLKEGNDTAVTDYQERYRTYKEALAGHRKVVRMVINEFREKNKK